MPACSRGEAFHSHLFDLYPFSPPPYTYNTPAAVYVEHLPCLWPLWRGREEEASLAAAAQPAILSPFYLPSLQPCAAVTMAIHAHFVVGTHSAIGFVVRCDVVRFGFHYSSVAAFVLHPMPCHFSIPVHFDFIFNFSASFNFYGFVLLFIFAFCGGRIRLAGTTYVLLCLLYLFLLSHLRIPQSACIWHVVALCILWFCCFVHFIL